MLAALGATTTLATGTGTTVMTDEALFPCDVALTVIVPGATAVTRPPAETVAIKGWLATQVHVAPGIAVPAASRRAAVSWAVCPGWSCTPAGATDGVASPLGTTRAT